MFTTDPTNIQVGQRWFDVDTRNSITVGKNGRTLKKPLRREVEIVALPTLSSPGVFRVVSAPKAPHTVGKLREFTRGKLIDNYVRKGL